MPVLLDRGVDAASAAPGGDVGRAGPGALAGDEDQRAPLLTDRQQPVPGVPGARPAEHGVDPAVRLAVLVELPDRGDDQVAVGPHQVDGGRLVAETGHRPLHHGLQRPGEAAGRVEVRYDAVQAAQGLKPDVRLRLGVHHALPP